VAAVCQLLEEFKIVFAEANLLNKQKPQSQELSNGDGDGDGSGRRGQWISSLEASEVQP